MRALVERSSHEPSWFLSVSSGRGNSATSGFTVCIRFPNNLVTHDFYCFCVIRESRMKRRGLGVLQEALVLSV